LKLGYRISKNKPNGELELKINNRGMIPVQLGMLDDTYQSIAKKLSVAAGAQTSIIVATLSSFGWYDFTVTVEGFPQFLKHYAGHVETGEFSRTDPAM
jgi:phospholipase C